MLGKLMKYEFRATGRIFLPMMLALVVISGVSRLFRLVNLNTPGIIGTIVSIIMIVGIFVIVLILTIQRFNKNLLSSEGYLMMTLPVKTDSIIFSKLLVSAVWSIATFIVVCLSIFIMVISKDVMNDIIDMIRWALERLLDSPFQVGILIFEILIMIALSLLSQALLIYASLSLSMLVNKHRGLFSFAAYIGITTVLQILVSVIVTIVVALNLHRAIERLFSNLSVFSISQVIIVAVIIGTLILGSIYYILTRAMLKNRLNLQ